MFSLFKGGIAKVRPSATISIEKLLKLIKTRNIAVEEIRKLDPVKLGKDEYDKQKDALKVKLDNITPTCTVSYRDKKHIVNFSGYMYLDVDFDPQIYSQEQTREKKKEIIEKYKDVVKLVCISTSGYGISILVKVENEISENNFASIRKYICEEIFTDLRLDPHTKDIARAWYIPMDEDCYYNPYSVIEIPESAIHTILNSSSDSVPFALSEKINAGRKTGKGDYEYNLVKSEVWSSELKFKTHVEVKNRVFDMRPVEYCEVFIHKNYRIPDKRKMPEFGRLIHSLIYLNPDANPDNIFSYISYINQNRTVKPALFKNLKRYFDMVYCGVKKNGILKPNIKIKTFHCKDNTISPLERNMLSKRITALYRMYVSSEMVYCAKRILELSKSANHTILNPSSDSVRFALSPCGRITQQVVCDFINERAIQINEDCKKKAISIRTVKTYWDVEPIDFDEFVEMENEKIVITYVPVELNSQRVDSGVLDTQIPEETAIAMEDKSETGLTAAEQEYIDGLEKMRRRDEERTKEQEMIRQSYLDKTVKGSRW